jgi:hypothetical protein
MALLGGGRFNARRGFGGGSWLLRRGTYRVVSFRHFIVINETLNYILVGCE